MNLFSIDFCGVDPGEPMASIGGPMGDASIDIYLSGLLAVILFD